MAGWNFLSFEVVLFVSVLYLYMQFRKSNILSLKPVRNLIVYVPPQDEDFEVLEKTNKGGRENKKGEVNKYDKKKVSAKAKFPLRTIEINEAFLKHNQEFFVEYDFFFMLFVVILGLFAITQGTKLVYPSLLETNIIFYMMIFLLAMAGMNLCKNTFSLGYFKYSDETKIELLFAIKAFIVSFVCLKTFGSTTFFDFNIEKAHDESQARVNQILSLIGGKLSLPYDFTYGIIGATAGLLTFCTVRLNIRFSYYFYVLTKNSAALLSSRVADTPENKRYKRHLLLMYLNMLSPLLVVTFFITPLIETLLVPDYIPLELWKGLRLLFVIGVVCLRSATFREELQFHFNESYFYV